MTLGLRIARVAAGIGGGVGAGTNEESWFDPAGPWWWLAVRSGSGVRGTSVGLFRVDVTEAGLDELDVLTRAVSLLQARGETAQTSFGETVTVSLADADGTFAAAVTIAGEDPWLTVRRETERLAQRAFAQPYAAIAGEVRQPAGTATTAAVLVLRHGGSAPLSLMLDREASSVQHWCDGAVQYWERLPESAVGLLSVGGELLDGVQLPARFEPGTVGVLPLSVPPAGVTFSVDRRAHV